jgi:hypothetical protein
MSDKFLSSTDPKTLEICKVFGVTDTEFLTRVKIDMVAGEMVEVTTTHVRMVKEDQANVAIELVRKYNLTFSEPIAESQGLMP